MYTTRSHPPLRKTIKRKSAVAGKVLKYETMAVPPAAAYMKPHSGDMKLSAALEDMPEYPPRT